MENDEAEKTVTESGSSNSCFSRWQQAVSRRDPRPPARRWRTRGRKAPPARPPCSKGPSTGATPGRSRTSPQSGKTASARPPRARPAQRPTSGHPRRGPPRQEKTRCTHRISPSLVTSSGHPRHRHPSPGWCGTDTGPGKTALLAPIQARHKSPPNLCHISFKYTENTQKTGNNKTARASVGVRSRELVSGLVLTGRGGSMASLHSPALLSRGGEDTGSRSEEVNLASGSLDALREP